MVAAIALPPSLFTNINNRSQEGIFFALYTQSTLFPIQVTENTTGAVASRSTVVGSTIIAATVGSGLSFNNLEPPVEINLRISTTNESVRPTLLFSFYIIMYPENVLAISIFG